MEGVAAAEVASSVLLTAAGSAAPPRLRFPRPAAHPFPPARRRRGSLLCLPSDERSRRCVQNMGNKQTVFSEEQLEDYTVRDRQRMEGDLN